MSDFVTALREELVGAAERERSRRLPRWHPPAPRVGLAFGGDRGDRADRAPGGRRAEHADARRRAPRPRRARRRRATCSAATLQPGVRYRTRAFAPALSFAVTGDELAGRRHDPARRAGPRPRRGLFDPGRRAPPARRLWFTRVLQVYDPAVRGLASSVRAGTRRPPRLDARRTPTCASGPERPVTVAGVPGNRFDVAVRFRRPTHDLPDCRRRFQVTCTALTPRMAFQDRTLLRVTILDTEPEPLVIMLEQLHEGRPPRHGGGGRPRARLAADRRPLAQFTVSVPSMPWAR